MGKIVRSPEQPEAAHFQTSELRYSVMVKGRLFNDDFPEGLSLRILNISEGGILAAIPYGVRVYSEVTVELRNLPPVTGRIAWCRKDRIGVAFDERIDLELFFGRQKPAVPERALHVFDAADTVIRSDPLIRKLNG
jgi:hypothetical protein